ncbi:hypothetical protein GCM10007385_23000 [Tateyamaria omphalii]|uniref:Hint domain-containing protein n=1 Tax=Tateyamaria omphalii TaxID=299262 RepID=UPI00167BCF64|nr:Hint domain-containing protein [Tateyamaria omphalii]GGX54198.1 hypothetical protein GCM10007385_23000 [Tateyamaria omphalii]
MPLVLDWATIRAPSADDVVITDGTDSVTVDIDSDNPIGRGDWIFNRGAGGHISAASSFTTDPRTSSFSFDAPVENLSFEIFDVDAVGTVFQDTVQVLAFDADGNSVPITFSDLESYHVLDDANTVRAIGASSTAYNTTGAPDSVTVTIDQPIVRLEVSFLRAPGTSRTGQVGISDITFDVVCFVHGTQLLTKSGQISVEDIKVGDLIVTRDNGYQKVRWIGCKSFSRFDILENPHLAPIRIRAGALGPNNPENDLLVSPQHRLLLSGPNAELMYGSSEVLAPAKSLVTDQSAEVCEPDAVRYYHILFDQHEIVNSEGAWTESFHPGSFGLGILDEKPRSELLEVFPELGAFDGSYGPAARRSLTVKEGQILLSS